MDINDGRAVIEGDALVIRLPLAQLPQVVEGGWASGNLDVRYKVTDANVFARDLVSGLNREEEDGSTPINRMFDAAIDAAVGQGAEGIEEHEEQDA